MPHSLVKVRDETKWESKAEYKYGRIAKGVRLLLPGALWVYVEAEEGEDWVGLCMDRKASTCNKIVRKGTKDGKPVDVEGYLVRKA